MRLLVDVGNTRIKWAVIEGTEMGDPVAMDYLKDGLPGLLEDHWQSLPVPQQVGVANVCGETAAVAISSYVRKQWRLEPVYAEVRIAEAGVTNAYHDISQLGVDRWLTVIAAWNKYHAPVCVAGCGTAVTIDVVDGDGQHLGGLILPGLRLMQDTLITGTHGIGSAESVGLSLELGDSTSSCIANGAARALISTIDGICEDMNRKFGDRLCRVITGGDAVVINGLLREKFICEQSLVLQGLAITMVNDV